MGHRECFAFGERVLSPALISGRDVLEVGAHEDGGSMRPYVASHGPRSYVGVDIQSGPGVDVVLDAMSLLDSLGPASFDIIIANELMEHIRDWRRFVHILKALMRPNGVVVITTRSIGFPFHHAPFDFWRYEEDDMRTIFADCEIIALESDTREVNGHVTPGVFVAARMPPDFREADLRRVALYSIIKEARTFDVHAWDILRYEITRLGVRYFRRHHWLPYLLRDFLSRAFIRPLRGR